MIQGVGREKKYRRMDSMRVQRFVPVASTDIYKVKMSAVQEAEFAKRCEKLNRK